MLKKRIAATLTIKNSIVVQSVGFAKYLPIGRTDIAIEFLNSWGIDEIFWIDISATRNKRPPEFELIKQAGEKCFVPLTVGGGIDSLNVVDQLMHCGVDKVAFNQAAFSNTKIIEETSKTYGNQCVVLSIDVLEIMGKYYVYDYINKIHINIKPSEFAIRFESMGVGEILLNSVNKDGKYEGYDLELIKDVSNSVNIPVIASGGAKSGFDMINVFKNTNACAASAGNFFHFTEHSVNLCKSTINRLSDIPIRLDMVADYKESQIDKNGRLLKIADDRLQELLYVKLNKEII